MKKMISRRSFLKATAALGAAGALAACGGSSSSSTASSGAASSEGASGQYTGEPEPLTLPLCEEKTTLKVYAKNSSSGVLSDYGQLKAFQVAAEKLNVEIEWVMPATGSENDQFNLMIASNEYPDIIFWDFSSTPMKLAGLKEDGVIIPMDNLIRQYAPDYLAWLESDEAMYKQAISDNGTFDAMYKLEPDPARLSHSGPAIRKDLLDKYGLAVPETIDEWHDALATIKAGEGTSAPLMGTQNTTGGKHFGIFMAAYHTMADFHNDVETGKIVYGPATEGFKQYLTTMAQWYAEGLIDPEYMSTDTRTAVGNISSGKTIAGLMMLGYIFGSVTNSVRPSMPEFELTGTPYPVLHKGDKVYGNFYEANIRVGGMAGAITCSCKDPVLATKLMDYYYTEEGADLLNWGIEGESYTVENGKKVYTDAVLHNPDGKSASEAVQQWAQPLQGFTKPMEYDAWSQITLVLPEQVAANKMWASADNSMVLPNLELAADINDKYSRIMTDVSTFMDEQATLFITGQLSIEKDWDSYISTMNSMGLQDAIAYKQAAWDAFNAR